MSKKPTKSCLLQVDGGGFENKKCVFENKSPEFDNKTPKLKINRWNLKIKPQN